MKVRLVRCIAALAAVCVFSAIAAAPGKAEPLSDSDRQALRVFRINRLFAALGYLEQQEPTGPFPSTRPVLARWETHGAGSTRRDAGSPK